MECPKENTRLKSDSIPSLCLTRHRKLVVIYSSQQETFSKLEEESEEQNKILKK